LKSRKSPRQQGFLRAGSDLDTCAVHLSALSPNLDVSVAKMSRADMAQFYKSWFKPNNANSSIPT
jgi:hypothetical protein